MLDREALAQGRVVETPDGQPVMSVGRPVGQLVRIVHDGHEQPEGEVGEIWVHGPNVASGYWGAATRTRSAASSTGAAAGCAPATSACSTAATSTSPAGSRT